MTRLCVDCGFERPLSDFYCTSTGKPRGPLGDDPDRVMAAAAYLLAHTDVLGVR